ncbi:MAG: dephospho-CoA kinase [Lachnospiraceae bacterium]|jgi:cytidylate kinase|nr:dephospho-CoA kinase [Lachnospiraceae bacterium]
MNISITGNLGAGKSSVCHELAEKGYEIISAGTLFRQIAVEHHMSVEELNRKAAEEVSKSGKSSIDDMLDQRTAQLNAMKDGAVFDSRLAWNFAKGSYRVFLTVDLDESAARVFGDQNRRASEAFETLEQCRASIINRQGLEKTRFAKLYGINYYDMSNYDLVIDCTHVSPSEAADEIERCYKSRESGRVELNPRSIYPTHASEGRPEDAVPDAAVRVSPRCCGWFAAEGEQGLLHALHERKRFIRVVVDPDAAVSVLTPGEYRVYEKAGGFRYRRYPVPEDAAQKTIYDFPPVSGNSR